MGKLKCKYCGGVISEKENLEHLEGLISHPKCCEAVKELIERIRNLINKEDIIEVLDLIHPATSNLDAFFLMKLFLGLSFVSSDSFTSVRNSINTVITGREGHFKSSIILEFAKILGHTEIGIYSHRIYSQTKMTGLLSTFNKKLLIIDNARALTHPTTDVLRWLEEGIVRHNSDGTLINKECKGSVACIGNRLADNVLQRFDLHYEMPILAKEDVEKITGQLLFYLSGKDSNIIREYLIKAKNIYPKVVLDKNVMAKLDLIALSLRDRYKAIKLIKGIAALRLRTSANVEDFEFIQNRLKPNGCKGCGNYEGCWILQDYGKAKVILKKLGLTMISKKDDYARICPYFNKTLGKPADYEPTWRYLTH